MSKKGMLDHAPVPGQVVHVRVPGEDYVPPPVPNLQALVAVPGRQPLPAEQPAYVAAEREVSAATVAHLIETIDHDTKRAAPGPTDEAVEASRAASVDMIKTALRRQPRDPAIDGRVEREARAHAENQALIQAEMRVATHTDAYSG